METKEQRDLMKEIKAQVEEMDIGIDFDAVEEDDVKPKPFEDNRVRTTIYIDRGMLYRIRAFLLVKIGDGGRKINFSNWVEEKIAEALEEMPDVKIKRPKKVSDKEMAEYVSISLASSLSDDDS